jgi:hypothetical protein
MPRGRPAAGNAAARQCGGFADSGRGGLVITERGQVGGVVEQDSPQVT